MQIVINIPEKVYSFIATECNDVTISESEAPFEYIIRGIIDGTVLPKGHGELIDKNIVLDMMNYGILEEYITTMNGVIPADKEAEND